MANPKAVLAAHFTLAKGNPMIGSLRALARSLYNLTPRGREAARRRARLQEIKARCG